MVALPPGVGERRGRAGGWALGGLTTSGAFPFSDTLSASRDAQGRQRPHVDGVPLEAGNGQGGNVSGLVEAVLGLRRALEVECGDAVGEVVLEVTPRVLDVLALEAANARRVSAMGPALERPRWLRLHTPSGGVTVREGPPSA